MVTSRTCFFDARFAFELFLFKKDTIFSLKSNFFIFFLSNVPGVLHLKLVIQGQEAHFKPYAENWGGLRNSGGVVLAETGAKNFNTKHGEPGPMWRASDYVRAGLVETPFIVRHFLVEKYSHLRYQTRWLQIMSSGNKLAMSWSDKWGKFKVFSTKKLSCYHFLFFF